MGVINMNDRKRLHTKITNRIHGKKIKKALNEAEKALNDAEQAMRCSNHAITHATNILKEGRIA